MQYHLAAPCTHRLDLDLGRGARHHDGRLHAHVPSRVGQALGMVAGRRRYHTTGSLLVGQLRQLVIGTANLEGEHRLQIFALEQDSVAQSLGEKGRRVHRGFHRHIVNR